MNNPAIIECDKKESGGVFRIVFRGAEESDYSRATQKLNDAKKRY
jgi:hypothetical protein